MFSTYLKRPLLAVAVTAGRLAAAGPASRATTHEPNIESHGHTVAVESFFLDIGTTEALHRVGKPADAAGAIVYNGHAGLGANSAQAELDANANAVFSGNASTTKWASWPCRRSALQQTKARLSRRLSERSLDRSEFLMAIGDLSRHRI